jgi:NADH dehydrogenase
MMRHIIITGGSGYIGERVVRLALQQGRRVTCLTRHPQTAADVAWSLGKVLPALSGIDDQTAIIHLAHDWKNSAAPNGEPGGLNKDGTLRLYQSAQSVGIRRFVFVSSQSARSDAANIYGRTKWQTEQMLQSIDSVAARVGLVYGGPRRAMFGLLNKLVSRLPLVPMVDPQTLVQPIHVDEVAAGLLALADGQQGGWQGLAGEPVTFDHVLITLGREAQGRRIFILPIPLRFALWTAAMINSVPFLPKVDKERILGLAGTRVVECAAHLRDMRLQVAPMETGLRRDFWGTRGLLVEGRALIAYALSEKATPALLRRYVKAMRLLYPNQGPIGLLPLFLRLPFTLRLIEPLNKQRPLAERLQIAMTLAHTSTTGGKIYTVPRSSRIARVTLLLCIDMLALPFRWIAQTVMR